jgi:hypothetical protein
MCGYGMWSLFPGDAWLGATASSLRNKLLQTPLSFAGVCSGVGVGYVSSWTGVFGRPVRGADQVHDFCFFFNADEVDSGSCGDYQINTSSSSMFVLLRLIRYGVDGGPVHEANSSMRIHAGMKRFLGSGGRRRHRQRLQRRRMKEEIDPRAFCCDS